MSARVPLRAIEKIFEAQGEGRRDFYRTLPDRVRHFLGPTFGEQLDELPHVDRHTLRASIDWARRQWSNPTTRTFGEPLFPSERHHQDRNESRQKSLPPVSAGTIGALGTTEVCSMCGKEAQDQESCIRHNCPWKPQPFRRVGTVGEDG